MLVVTRKKGESIVLIQDGEVIAKITVRRFPTQSRVQIGILGDVKVLRSELLTRPVLAVTPPPAEAEVT
jgi:sRNA-binding carbon storage regulator CsrA